MGQANRRKREKTNNEKGLKTEDRLGQPKIKRENKWILGLITGGMAGQLKEKREKEWISRCSKQGAGRTTLRKKEKMNVLVGVKNKGQGWPT